jgi:hypothetical protein
MKLLTQELERKLIAAQNPNAENAMVLAKFFTPDANATWFVTEYDPENRTFFGFCNLGDDLNAELGYVSRDELESIRGRFGLPVERDRHWAPVPLSEVQSFNAR